MDLSFSPDDDSFRTEVRVFIREHFLPETRAANPHADLTKQQMLLWHRILHKNGWIAPSWPKDVKRLTAINMQFYPDHHLGRCLRVA